MDVHSRSWLQLLIFFAFATLASSLVLAALFAGVTAAVAGGDAAQASDDPPAGVNRLEAAYSGIITDAQCGPQHTGPEQSAAECARMCVHNGSRYTLVDGDKTYKLAGNLPQIDQFAGQRVTVTGVLDGDTLTLNSASFDARGH